MKKSAIGLGFAITATLLLLSGCGAVSSSLNTDKQGALKGRTVTVVQKDTLVKPSLMGTTVTGMTSAVILSSVAQGIDNRKTTGPVYAQPTQEISTKTMALLSKRFGMREIKNTGEKEIKSDYVLKVKTLWMVQQVYRLPGYITMDNTIELIDQRTKKVVAKALCQYGDENKEKIPTMLVSTMAANDGKIIRREARKAINSCMKKINTQILAEPGKAQPITDADFMHRPLI